MEVDPLEQAEARLAAECFRVNFLGDAHQQVYKQIQKLRGDANRSFHYSPYSAFVQASCVGKTRSVMEMSRLGVYICYCSLASKDSSAYPPRTELLADRLAVSFTELEMVLYLKAWVLVLAMELEKGTSALEWKDKQLPGSKSGIVEAVMEKWEELIASPSHSAKEYEADERDRDVVNGEIMGEALDRLQQLMDGDDDMDLDSGSDEPRVIFVFDEARGLVPTTELKETPFDQLRRALRVFFPWRDYFALMLDTSAKLSNLLPRKQNNDSSRALEKGITLLPPIYYLPTLQLNMPKPGLSVAEYTAQSTWMKYGRPMWAARMAREGDNEVALSKLLAFAKQKLMGGGISKELAEEGKLTESEAMALLAGATGLQVCPRCPLAEKMVASHMNLVLRVTEDRSRMFVGLPAEPILSEAAAGLLKSEKVKLNALMRMEAACLAGYATGGPRGEFVAKFILAAAVWDLAKNRRYLQPIEVQDFFRTLLVNTKRDKRTKDAFENFASRLPADGIVFFNSFVELAKVPDTAALARCFAAGHAIMYEADNDMPGGDVIIPIWTAKGMTCSVMSVNDQDNRGWWEGPSLEALQSEFTKLKVGDGLPMITVLMSMREPAVAEAAGSQKAWLLWEHEDKRYVQVTCYGLADNYSYLSREVKSLLKKILVIRPGPLKGAEACEAQWIKRMLPYWYARVTDFVVVETDVETTKSSKRRKKPC